MNPQNKILSEHNRPAIGKLIDRSYMTSVIHATRLQMYLIDPKGPIKPLYLEFYECFSTLFMLTSSYKDLIDDDLREKVSGWLKVEKIDENAAKSGLELFAEYRQKLANKSVINYR